MTLPTLAVLMPGDMGHAVGRVLREHDHRVLTCLARRSETTRSLAAAAGLEDAGDLKSLVREADMILSILPPAYALAQAEQVAKAMGESGATPIYVDCNAISPALTLKAGEAEISTGAYSTGSSGTPTPRPRSSMTG